jgi:acyl dehydratase
VSGRPTRVALRGLPSVWTSYPFVVLRRRPPAELAGELPELVATTTGVRIDRARLGRYARVCGFGTPQAALLTYPHVLAMPLHLRIFAMPQFRLRPMGLIHLSNEIELLAPIAALEAASLDVEVVARNFRRADLGVHFDVATEIRADGRPTWRESCEFLSRFSAPVEGAGRPPRPPKAPKDARVLGEYALELRTAWDYARVSADFNPIHLSDRTARRLGLRGAIMHGLWSLARSVAAEPTCRLEPGLRLDTQFLSPVQLPARVTLKEWQEKPAMQRRALCDTRTGRVYMYAGLHVPVGGDAGAA